MLVLGAAGGVGVAAVQISKVLGAKVVAVARGESKAKLLKDLGADAVIDTSANHQVSHVTGLLAVLHLGVNAVLTGMTLLSKCPAQPAFFNIRYYCHDRRKRPVSLASQSFNVHACLVLLCMHSCMMGKRFPQSPVSLVTWPLSGHCACSVGKACTSQHSTAVHQPWQQTLRATCQSLSNIAEHAGPHSLSKCKPLQAFSCHV